MKSAVAFGVFKMKGTWASVFSAALLLSLSAVLPAATPAKDNKPSAPLKQDNLPTSAIEVNNHRASTITQGNDSPSSPAHDNHSTNALSKSDNSSIAFAQGLRSASEADRSPVQILRLKGPVTLDGLSDEEAWEGAQQFPMVMLIPTFGIPPTEKTEVFLGFDDDYLYVAGRLYDSEPDKICCPSKKRDYFEANTDWFGIVVDTFNDKENAVGFMTTPTGLRWDGNIINDAEMRNPNQLPVNISWNTFWDVKAVRNDEGWFAEMRIPFSSLRFQTQDNKVVMGLIIWRWVARKNEFNVFPPIDPKYGMMGGWKPSQAHEIFMEGVRSKKPVYITPYALGGYGQSYDLNDDETAYIHSNDPVHELGLDVKLGLTSNLTLDLTVNTDFAQVEADDLQVNLTRFSLFFPEKRLFFLERPGIFDFSFGGYDQLFYSRRIGLYEEQKVRIYGGARLVGRVGGWDVGFLDMQTAPVEDLSTENFGVFRLRRRVFNPFSYLGGMVTSRLGKDGAYNVAYGFDGTFRLKGEHYLLFNWAQTFTDGLSNRLAKLESARFRIGWERRTIEGLGFRLSYSRAGEDYDPGMGFQMREDFTEFGHRVLYGWLPGEKSFLQSHNVFLSGFLVLRNVDNTLESAEFGPGWEFSTKSGIYGNVAFLGYRESLREPFELSDDIEIPVGEYSFYGVRGMLMTPQGRTLSSTFMLDAGSFYDGKRVTASAMPIWAISRDLMFSGLYQFNRVTFPTRDETWTAHILRARILATLSLKLSVSTFVQYNSADDTVVANLRVRFNPREGNDLYIVFNEDFNTDRRKEIPFLPPYGSRALMVKYSYTFNF